VTAVRLDDCSLVVTNVVGSSMKIDRSDDSSRTIDRPWFEMSTLLVAILVGILLMLLA